MKPLAIDLFCGLGGWTEGLMAEGYEVLGFDITPHAYGAHRYPAQLVLQDVLTLNGAQFKDAALIVASPPADILDNERNMPTRRRTGFGLNPKTRLEQTIIGRRQRFGALPRHRPIAVRLAGCAKVGRAGALALRQFLPVGRCAGADADGAPPR